MNEGAMQERIVLCRTPDEIQALLERFHMVLPSLKRGKAFRAAMAEKFFQHGKVVFIPEDGRAVGFAAFYCNDHVERKDYLSMIAVYPDMQGKGCGKELLTYVEHTAKDCGMRTVWLEVSKANGSARSFYRKNGYVPVEMRPESMICAKKLENASDEWTEDTHDV